MKENLFSVPIYKTRIVPTPEQYNGLDYLLANMFASAPTNEWAMETGKSTGSHTLNLHFYHDMDWLGVHLRQHVKAFWDELNYRKDAEIMPIASWANLHLNGDVTGVHSHCGGAEVSHISAVYYFKKPAGSGNIEFVDPLEYIKQMVPIHHYSEKDSFKEVEADQFDLILFPSWLKHRTQANSTNRERVAISINFVGYWQYN